MWPARSCVACRGAGRGLLCPDCRSALASAPTLAPPEGLDACAALLAYEGAGRELVAAFKFHQRREVAARLAPALARLVTWEVDVVTWLPTTPARRRARGYDQARLLARAVATRLDVQRARPLLRRLPGPAQTGRPAAARAAGPRYRVRPVPRGARVLVVDDVITTGASVRAAADVLRRAGAGRVSALALARTPLKTRSSSAETCT